MPLAFWVFASVFMISITSLTGLVFLSADPARLKQMVSFLISLAVGALLGEAFLHLMPESLSQAGMATRAPFWVLLGFMVFFLLEKLLRWNHQHGDAGHGLKPFAIVNLFGDAFHNFIDGVLVAATFQVDLRLGFSTALAVFFHEIPHEISHFGVLVHGGFPPRRAVLMNLLTALVAMIGAAVSLLLGSEVQGFSQMLVPVTAGGFIYVAASDLVPELHHEVRVSKSLLQVVGILLGIALMQLVRLLEG